MSEKIITTERGVKISIMLTGATLIAYFSGPFAAIAAREGFTYIYGHLYGIPSYFSIENWTVFSPMREHIAHLAYNYGAGTLALVCAPVLYKSWDFFKWAFGFSKRSQEEIECEHISDLSEEVHVLDSHLQELARILRDNKSVAMTEVLKKPKLWSSQNDVYKPEISKRGHGVRHPTKGGCMVEIKPRIQ
ncbi:MAG: hypothetical protein U1E78_08800 [Gammaproteobacteria bacterium]